MTKPLDPDATRRAFAELRAQVRDLRARLEYAERAAGLFVPEEDLDRRGGDPVVKFVPRGWRGENVEGRRFSACPPEFLDHLAGALRSMSERPPKDPTKDFRAKNREDAAFARTWARVLRRRAAEEAAKAAKEAEGEFL